MPNHCGKTMPNHCGKTMASSSKLDKSLILLIVIVSALCFIAGLCEFAYSIWFGATKTEIKDIMYAGYQPNSMVGCFFIMPTAGAIQTVQPFIQALIMLSLYLKYKHFMACKTNIVIVIIFSAILSIVFIVIAIVSLAYVHTFNTDIKEAMETTLSKYQGYPLGYEVDSSLSRNWDTLMLKQQCCGVNGQNDFIAGEPGFLATSWRAASLNYTVGGTTYKDNQVKVPMSCCKVNSGIIKEDEKISMSTLQSNLQSESCPVDLSNVQTSGCRDALLQMLTQFVIATQSINLVVGFIYMLLVILALILFKMMREECKEVAEKN